MTTRRERILAEGMRLFGERGYAATSVAQIEEAAGLAPGSGSLYKHFKSKEELLSVGLEQLLASRERTLAPLEERSADPATPDTEAALEAAARAGLDRMEQDRDLNRVLFRGLTEFPELLRKFGDKEIARIGQDTARFLAGLSDERHPADWEALATVLQGATAHYWLLEDLFGTHPSGVSRERFVTALVSLAAAGVGAPPQR